SDALAGVGKPVRVMTGDAAELAVAPLEAAAGVQLLDVSDRLLARPQFRGAHEHRPEGVQRQPRPVVEGVPAAPLDAEVALKVALLADGVAQGRLQLPRVDDGLCCRGEPFAVALPHVQFARAMAALAADGEAAEDRRLIVVA